MFPAFMRVPLEEGLFAAINVEQIASIEEELIGPLGRQKSRCIITLIGGKVLVSVETFEKFAKLLDEGHS